MERNDIQKISSETANIPVYKQSAEYAIEHDELPAYRKSFRVNMACRDALETAIHESYHDYCLDAGKASAQVRSLGEGYSEEELRAVILCTRVHTPRRKKTYPSKVSRPTLISQIEAKIGSGKGAAYDQKLKVVKLKSMAETLLFIQKHDFADFDALSDYADTASNKAKELTAKIKAAESHMAEIAVLKTHIINYAKTRDIYTAYRKAGYSKKYYDAHESDIIIHKASKKAFDELTLKKLPTVKSLQAEYSDLLVQKKLNYAELSKARDEAKQLQIYKANAEMLLRTDAEEQRQTRERQQEK